MRKPKVLLLRTAGTNCDIETAAAFEFAGAETTLGHIQNLISGKIDLDDYQILVIPGGFSYGDDISAGILLAVEMKYKLTTALSQFIAHGKLILGICNGFQVLVRMGLLPGGLRKNSGMPETVQRATLAMNSSGKFDCRWVDLELEESVCIFTKGIGSRVYLPIAHAEGRFTTSADVVTELERNQQVVLRYAPYNPNGSDADIAGICDISGRIFGLMPHPERFLTKWNHPRWTRLPKTELAASAEGDGLAFFENAIAYAKTL